jgi:hypothetical protein
MIVACKGQVKSLEALFVFCTHRSSRLKEAKVGCNVVYDLHHLFKALLLCRSSYVNVPSCRCASNGGRSMMEEGKIDAARKQDERRG